MPASPSIVVTAPPGLLGLSWRPVQDANGGGRTIFCEVADDSVLKGQVRDQMILAKVDGMDVTGLDQWDLGELFAAKRDVEKVLE